MTNSGDGEVRNMSLAEMRISEATTAEIHQAARQALASGSRPRVSVIIAGMMAAGSMTERGAWRVPSRVIDGICGKIKAANEGRA